MCNTARAKTHVVETYLKTDCEFLKKRNFHFFYKIGRDFKYLFCKVALLISNYVTRELYYMYKLRLLISNICFKYL